MAKSTTLMLSPGQLAKTYFGYINHVAPFSVGSDDFLVDSGAKHHLVADRSQLIDTTPTTPITFGLAGSGTLLSNTRRDIPVGGTRIKDVYHVPGVRVPTLSVRKLQNQGWKVDFDKNVIVINGSTFPIRTNSLPMVRLPRTDNIIPRPLGLNAFAVRHTDSPLFLEHCRLGHMSRERLINLAKGGHLRYDLSFERCTHSVGDPSRNIP